MLIYRCFTFNYHSGLARHGGAPFGFGGVFMNMMENNLPVAGGCVKHYSPVPFLLPGNQETEAINKQQIFNALKQATRQTSKGKYGKGAHSFDILENLDPQKVQNASPWAKRLIDELCERV